MERITNMDMLKQVLSTHNLIPTPHAYCGDVDMVVRMKNVCILIDVKTYGKNMTHAQKRTYEHIADALQEYGDEAYVLTLWHTVRDTNLPIYINQCEVSMQYREGKETYFDQPVNAGKYIRDIMAKHGIDVYD